MYVPMAEHAHTGSQLAYLIRSWGLKVLGACSYFGVSPGKFWFAIYASNYQYLNVACQFLGSLWALLFTPIYDIVRGDSVDLSYTYGHYCIWFHLFTRGCLVETVDGWMYVSLFFKNCWVRELTTG